MGTRGSGYAAPGSSRFVVDDVVSSLPSAVPDVAAADGILLG